MSILLVEFVYLHVSFCKVIPSDSTPVSVQIFQTSKDPWSHSERVLYVIAPFSIHHTLTNWSLLWQFSSVSRAVRFSTP